MAVRILRVVMRDEPGAAGDLSAATIEAAIKGRLGRPLRYLEVTASTNSDALDWAGQGAPEGALVVAGHQTAGRGRRGRGWFSPPGAALTFSLLLRPPLEPSSGGLLTATVGVACARGIASSCGLLPRLKWPNDVMIEGRKVGGILLESRVEAGRLDTVVAGVGINVTTLTNPPREVAGRATALAEHVTDPPSRQTLLGHILEEFERLYADVSTADFAGRVVGEASALSDVLGRDVIVRIADGTSIEGRAVRLTERGELEIDTATGAMAVHSGEIERLRTT